MFVSQCLGNRSLGTTILSFYLSVCFCFHFICGLSGSFWPADERGGGGARGGGDFLVCHCHTLLVHFSFKDLLYDTFFIPIELKLLLDICKCNFDFFFSSLMIDYRTTACRNQCESNFC